MNKKGGHVDWVISMGIFIVYVISLFILLRPGVTPSYRPTNLLDNLQSQFEEDTYWVVKYVPLFIRTCKPFDLDSPAVIGVDVRGVDESSGEWSISIALKEDGTEAKFEIKCTGSDDTEYAGSVIDIYLKQKGEIYEPDLYPVLSVDCNLEDDYCEAELGLVEDIIGINPDYLVVITKPDTYDTLKLDWGIPPDKDFAILKEDNSGITMKVIGENAPPQANVFVRRIDTQEVYDNGEIEGVKIYFQIW